MIRPYTNTDKSKVMELLRLNTPHYFDPSEEKYFNYYLDDKVEEYFVYEYNSEIIGAGGINYFPVENLARLSWDMIDPRSQGNGIGTKLMQHRIKRLNTNLNVELIVVRTTQLTYKFYEKMGFQLEKVEKDFWSKNFDLYQMEMANMVRI